MVGFVDKTASFKEVLSAREAAEAAADEECSDGAKRTKNQDRSRRILGGGAEKKRQHGHIFDGRARAIAADIARLSDFLAENRQDYVGESTKDFSSLSDRQRDRIDAGANHFVRTANGLIAKFRTDIRGEAGRELNPTTIRHLEAVCEILEGKLRAACDVYAGQRAIRVQKEIEVQKLSRLEVEARQLSQEEATLEDRERLLRERRQEEPRQTAGQRPMRPTPQQQPQPHFMESSSDEEELSPEEVQMLEEENARMYADFQQVRDTVQQVENKVVKIAELQEVFTEKVLQQKEDIETIAQNAIGTTENVKDGNEELRKAIQNQASIRVYVLFFLIVMSFSLLFLDWYNE